MSRVAITARIRNAHPDHRTIARGMALGALFVFLSKLAGAAKEMAVAWRYGVSETVDGYLYVFNLATWPVTVWFSILVVVLVPLAARIRERAPRELSRFRAELLGMTLLLGLSLWLFAHFLLPVVLRSPVSGLSGSGLENALGSAPALSAALFLAIPISLLAAWMQSSGLHENTLLEGVPPLVLLLALLLARTASVRVLAFGTLAGFACHFLSLTALLLKRGELERPRFAINSPNWSAFRAGFGIMLAGQALMSFTGVVDQFFAARIGPGAIARLSYSTRIVALVLGLGATAISRATLPVFSQAEAKGSTHVTRMATYWAGLLFLMGATAVLAGWWLAVPTVALLFERGAFTPENTRAVAELLRYGLVQLPFFFPALVLVSVISSRNQYGVLFISGCIGLATKLLSNALLVPVMGIDGLVLANAVVYMINCSFFLLVIKYRHERSS